jgi:hypothetical protein
MRLAPIDGAHGRHQRLPHHLAAKHPLPADLRAAAAEHVHLQRLEVEQLQQVCDGG